MDREGGPVTCLQLRMSSEGGEPGLRREPMGATAPLPYLVVDVSLLTFLRPAPLSGGPKSRV